MLYVTSLLTASVAGMLGWSLILSAQPLLGGLVLAIALYHGYVVSACMAGESTSLVKSLLNLYPGGKIL